MRVDARKKVETAVKFVEKTVPMVITCDRQCTKDDGDEFDARMTRQ